MTAPTRDSHNLDWPEGSAANILHPTYSVPADTHSGSISDPPMPTLASRRALVLAIAVGLTACASAIGRTEGPTVPIDLEVNNNLRLPADLSVYAVSGARIRTFLGSVAPGRTKILRFKPIAFTEPYRLLATRAAGRDILSQSFIVGSDMTGAIVWTLVPNIVGFENTGADSTGTTP